jgi:hypothetical protein
MLDLAAALEQAAHPDPACVTIVNELLHDGCSPIYNPSVPETQLTTALTNARSGLVVASPSGA